MHVVIFILLIAMGAWLESLREARRENRYRKTLAMHKAMHQIATQNGLPLPEPPPPPVHKRPLVEDEDDDDDLSAAACSYDDE